MLLDIQFCIRDVNNVIDCAENHKTILIEIPDFDLKENEKYDMDSRTIDPQFSKFIPNEFIGRYLTDKEVNQAYELAEKLEKENLSNVHP